MRDQFRHSTKYLDIDAIPPELHEATTRALVSVMASTENTHEDMLASGASSAHRTSRLRTTTPQRPTGSWPTTIATTSFAGNPCRSAGDRHPYSKTHPTTWRTLGCGTPGECLSITALFWPYGHRQSSSRGSPHGQVEIGGFWPPAISSYTRIPQDISPVTCKAGKRHSETHGRRHGWWGARRGPSSQL